MTHVTFLCLLKDVPEQFLVFTEVFHFETLFPVALPLVTLGFRKQASLKSRDTHHWLGLPSVCSKEM